MPELEAELEERGLSTEGLKGQLKKRLEEFDKKKSAEDVAASAASLLALAGQWECTACTTHNDTSKSVCSVCGAGKPGSEAKAGEGAGGAVVTGGGWA